MGTVDNREGGWLDHFISHRSASSHQRKMIFVHNRPGLDWNRWPGNERLKGKGFYFVYGQTPLLSPPHSLSCHSPHLPFPPPRTSLKKLLIHPVPSVLIAKHHMEICCGFVSASVLTVPPLCVPIDSSFKRDALTSVLQQPDRFRSGRLKQSPA